MSEGLTSITDGGATAAESNAATIGKRRVPDIAAGAKSDDLGAAGGVRAYATAEISSGIDSQVESRGCRSQGHHQDEQ